MTIQYHGDACVRISGKTTAGEFTVLCDPYSAAETGLKVMRPSSVDAVISTTGVLPEFGDGPYRIIGPGEYEVRGVMITGIAVGGRTIYRIDAEGVIVAFLGNLAAPFDDAIIAELGDIHACIIPVGGKGVLTAKQAGELIERLEPRVVVPIQYHISGTKLPYEGIEAFCKEVGCTTKDAEEKLRLAKKELPTEEMWVKVLVVT